MKLKAYLFYFYINMQNKQKIFCCKFCERNFYEHERKQHEQECKVKRAIEEHQNVKNEINPNNENPYNNEMGDDTRLAWKLLSEEVNEYENNRVINNVQKNENPYNNGMGEDTKLGWKLLFKDVNEREDNIDKKNAQNNENPYNNVMGDDTKLAWQLLYNDANNIENNKKKLEMFKDGYPNN